MSSWQPLLQARQALSGMALDVSLQVRRAGLADLSLPRGCLDVVREVEVVRSRIVEREYPELSARHFIVQRDVLPYVLPRV